MGDLVSISSQIVLTIHSRRESGELLFYMSVADVKEDALLKIHRACWRELLLSVRRCDATEYNSSWEQCHQCKLRREALGCLILSF